MATARWLRVLGMTTLLVVLYFVVPVSSDPRGGLALRTALASVVFVALAVVVVGQVRLVVLDPERHLDGLLLSIALVWVLFSLAFYIMSRQRPTEVAGLDTRVDALYFTASTILTIGYGDVHAVGQLARVLVLVQMGFDIVFVTLAARLVSRRVRGRAVARAELSAERTASQATDQVTDPATRHRWDTQRKPR